MTVKVFLRPAPDKIPGNNGIGRIVWAQYKYLPDYGVEFVDTPDEADVLAGHTDLVGVAKPDAIHTHGLYWNGDRAAPYGRYNDHNGEVNRKILDACMRARVVTVPSRWVGECFRRDCHIDPVIIGHGIDAAEWEPGQSGGYILWNKSRTGDVCDPSPAYELAKRGMAVVSTFAPPGQDAPPNMKITGHLTHPEMRDYVRAADLYLATTPETFGIGTLEAMCAGVPVLGYDWCGTAELVQHKVTGYLVEPGNLDGLREGAAWLREHRADIGAAARDAALRYDWSRVIGRYADLYQGLADSSEPGGVAVVVTNHNYGAHVGGAIESVLAQTRPVDELIVVDDGSTDGSLDVLEKYRGRDRVTVVAKANGGVASARNLGAATAQSAYLTFLDADDRIAPEFVDTLARALEADRGLGIAYSRMAFIGPDEQVSPSGWFADFDWNLQTQPKVPPVGMIPSACMFRRDLWQRAGGVKQDYAPGEDSEFWTRGLSTGYRAACVTEQPLFHYRNHLDGAHVRLKYARTDEWSPWMRDRQFPMAAPSGETATVRSYSRAAIAVILVNPDTSPHRVNDLDKLAGQELREWEAHSTTDAGNLPDAYLWLRTHDTLRDALSAVTAPIVAVVNGVDWRPDSLTKWLTSFATMDGRIMAGDGLFVAETWAARGLGPEGVERLMGCGCNNSAAKQAMAAVGLVPAEQKMPDAERVLRERAIVAQAASKPLDSERVRMMYTGGNDGPVTIVAKPSGRAYRVSRQPIHRFHDVPKDDVAYLISTSKFQILRQPEPPPEAAGVVFRYDGQGQMSVTGAGGQLLKVVNASARDRMLRVTGADIEHLRTRYAGALTEVGATGDGGG